MTFTLSYVKKSLGTDEKILYQPPISKIIYLWELANFAMSFMPFGLLRLVGTELALTNKRVLGKSGKKTITLAYADISHVTVRPGILGHFLGFGTVVINAKDGASVTFKGVVWPLIFQQEVDEAIEVAVLGKKLSDFAKEDTDTAKY